MPIRPCIRSVVAFLSLSFLSIGALAQSPGHDVRPPTNETSTRRSYVLGPDDQIVIHAADVPDISDKPQRIDSDGDLKMPMVGRIHAAGLTVIQLETEVTNRLKSYVHEPDVAVTVVEFKSQSVSVLGAVNTPGVQQLETATTLIEVLSKAGGPTADAGPTVRMTRRLSEGRIPLAEAAGTVDAEFSTAEIALKPLLDASSPDKNILVRPGDVVSVPRAQLVYVVGEVTKASQLPLTYGRSTSVVEAISAAGGMLRTASGKSARILRSTTGTPDRTEIAVDVDKIMQGRAPDVTLIAGDILIVPNDRGRAATKRALEAALQFGVMIGSYGIVR